MGSKKKTEKISVDFEKALMFVWESLKAVII